MKKNVSDKLRTLADEDYKAFNAKIIPTACNVLGVRMPALKVLAKEIAALPDAVKWLDEQDFPTYEHVILHGLVLAALSKKMPFNEVLARLDLLIEHFDNWAHVDSVFSAFKIFNKHKDEVFAHFLPLKTHSGEFHKRVFAVLLMDYLMDDVSIAMKHLAEIPLGQYYVDMAVAWAVSVALVKDWDAALPYIEERRFIPWVHNKAIQKARESFRIAPERKAMLRELGVPSLRGRSPKQSSL